MSDPRLSACAFCHSIAGPAVQREGTARYLIACERYVGGCEAATGPYPTEAAAIGAWNRVAARVDLESDAILAIEGN